MNCNGAGAEGVQQGEVMGVVPESTVHYEVEFHFKNSGFPYSWVLAGNSGTALGKADHHATVGDALRALTLFGATGSQGDLSIILEEAEPRIYRVATETRDVAPERKAVPLDQETYHLGRYVCVVPMEARHQYLDRDGSAVQDIASAHIFGSLDTLARFGLNNSYSWTYPMAVQECPLPPVTDTTRTLLGEGDPEGTYYIVENGSHTPIGTDESGRIGMVGLHRRDLATRYESVAAALLDVIRRGKTWGLVGTGDLRIMRTVPSSAEAKVTREIVPVTPELAAYTKHDGGRHDGLKYAIVCPLFEKKAGFEGANSLCVETVDQARLFPSVATARESFDGWTEPLLVLVRETKVDPEPVTSEVL